MTSSSALRDRWKSADGRQLQTAALRWLAGGQRPDGLGEVDGLIDLRGIESAEPMATRVVKAGETTYGLGPGVVRIEQVVWRRLDLSYASLPEFRFFDSSIADCRFDRANCRGWRLWNSSIEHSGFRGTNLRMAALGTWDSGRGNRLEDCKFESADLRQGIFHGGEIRATTFSDCKLAGCHFNLVDMQDCTFSGQVADVMFDAMPVAGMPEPRPLSRVDFSRAEFADVEFRSTRFDSVTLPPTVAEIRDFGLKAQVAIESLRDDMTEPARVLKAVLSGPAKRDPQASAAFNRSDYVVWGGSALADLAESYLLD